MVTISIKWLPINILWLPINLYVVTSLIFHGYHFCYFVVTNINGVIFHGYHLIKIFYGYHLIEKGAMKLTEYVFFF